MLLKSFVATLVLASGGFAVAKQTPDASAEFVQACVKSTDCELRFFNEVSKTYRPAKEEDELRDYILKIKATSEQIVWKTKLETFQDKIGNVLIRLPATGQYRKSKSDYFSLQSHMDMVLAYADAKPGEDLRPYFRDGVKTEIKDGWMHSVDNKTTLGSDNGIGVALELRYLIDPSISHPPMELIFTVQEEIGLLGAFGSELPILSKKMLCLDGMVPEAGYIIAGAQGASAKSVLLNSKVVNQASPSDLASVVVTLTKLAGGHSGNDIYRGRLNAMKAFAGLVKFVSSKVGEVEVKTLIVGDIGVANKIPALFQAELVMPKGMVSQELKAQIEGFLKNLISQNADDHNGVVEVVLKAASGDPLMTTSSDFTKNLVESILATPSGVIDQDPHYFNNIFTSNNISFLEVKPGADSNYAVNFGYMTRGFSADRIKQVSDSIDQRFLTLPQTSDGSIKSIMTIPPWMEPEQSPMLNTILTQTGYFNKKFYLNGGLEPSAFKQKIQDLQVVALGPMTQNAHSVSEALQIESIAPTVLGIQKVIQSQK